MELKSRIKAARNLIIGLWIIGIINLLLVIALTVQKREGANVTMGIIVGIASVAAAVHLIKRRGEFQAELDLRESDSVPRETYLCCSAAVNGRPESLLFVHLEQCRGR